MALLELDMGTLIQMPVAMALRRESWLVVSRATEVATLLGTLLLAELPAALQVMSTMNTRQTATMVRPISTPVDTVPKAGLWLEALKATGMATPLGMLL